MADKKEAPGGDFTLVVSSVRSMRYDGHLLPDLDIRAFVDDPTDLRRMLKSADASGNLHGATA
jgi:hypothetical protein